MLGRLAAWELKLTASWLSSLSTTLCRPHPLLVPCRISLFSDFHIWKELVTKMLSQLALEKVHSGLDWGLGVGKEAYMVYKY